MVTVAPINGLKLNIISMLNFPEICYYAISDFHFFTIFLEIRNRATWCKADSNLTVAPINGLKLNIISMLNFPEICYYAISDLFNAVQRLRGHN
ncbi:hypothetical protein T03_7575 [Trichinella britovi]|uniref:Uncharacterized protein n=1 Tax=Trichinella britovi TaxID=45882 RepID=A0A0V1C890_TRIBR|nr:hypothetical protein T03_7575 [Trichinella britovi]